MKAFKKLEDFKATDKLINFLSGIQMAAFLFTCDKDT